MGRKSRANIKNQIRHAIHSADKHGNSKRVDKMNGVDARGYNYSFKTTSALIKAGDHFARFLKENYSHIKMVRDITPEIFAHYYLENKSNWNDRTKYERLQHFKKIERELNNRYKLDLHFTDGADIAKTDVKIRNKAMKMDDYYAILNSFKDNSRSNAKRALEICYRCGLRANEVAHLRYTDINLDKGVLELREGTKNGRHRDVPIRPQDMEYFKKLKNTYRHGKSVYICGGTSAEGLNRTIRRHMKVLVDSQGTNLSDKYEKTTLHSVRKAYALDRMKELRGPIEINPEREFEAWIVVQQELGHGDKNRIDLYNTYVGEVSPNVLYVPGPNGFYWINEELHPSNSQK